MNDDQVITTLTIGAPAARIFAVLADPRTHAGIDGTGRVAEPVDTAALTEVGQVFRMRMYHPNHPDGDYETANQIIALEPLRAIAWKTGYDEKGDGHLKFGGWFWRYDLAASGPSETEVTLTYDWSAVTRSVRDLIGFPPFATKHFGDSLRHLAELATRA